MSQLRLAIAARRERRTTSSSWLRLLSIAPVRIDAITVAGVYLLAASLLLLGIGNHPPFAYNWENYTLWRFFPWWDHPSLDIFKPLDGLMTDSGKSPLVALPVWVGFQVGGMKLASLRVPVALVNACAAPLLWLVARVIAGRAVAVIVAVLLALCPAFLLYGRSATIVGISLVPALATIYALLQVLQLPCARRRVWVLWLLTLQVLLLVGMYAYAPIRSLWPLSLVLLLWESVGRRGERRRFGGPLYLDVISPTDHTATPKEQVIGAEIARSIFVSRPQEAPFDCL